MAVSFSANGKVGTILLDKPPANSYDADYMLEFEAAIADANASGAVVVVVRSASEKFFCAGADIKAFAANDADTNIAMIRKGHEVLASMAKSDKVFLAWIEGHALGGGLEITLGCDLRYALDADFKMGTPEINLGILPGNGGTQRLPRLIGRGPALNMLLTGVPVSPQEAHQLGIVNGLFDSAEDFEKFAGKFAAQAPLALRNIKRCVFEGGDMSLDDGLEFEIGQIDELFRTEDAEEGIGAFTEKRTAEFHGR